MDNKNAAAEKAGRRASFARALHVPNIARRVKQFEHSEHANQAPSPAPSRPQRTMRDAPESNTNKTVPELSRPTRETGGRDDEDVGGAEIPDIPLRRSSNTINSDLTGSSLGTLERMLAAGALQDGQHPGPLSFHPPQTSTEKRYDAQYHVPDEVSLYPPPECSWEASLPDLSEGSEGSEEPSMRRETASSPNWQHQDSQPRDMQRRGSSMWTALPSRRDTALPLEHSGHLAASPRDQYPSSPGRETAPSTLAESCSVSITTGTTSLQTFETDQESTVALSALPPLQAIGIDNPDALQPVSGEDVDPGSFDLVIPASNAAAYSLEHRSELLFSVEHMRIIILDPILLHRFATFIATYRPQSVLLLNYALEALKAIRAMEYMNSIISRSLRPDVQQLQNHPPDFAAKAVPELTVNESLKQKTAAAFEALAKDDLPAYITHIWMDIAEMSMRRKITGLMPKNLQYMSEGLAEVFCITDPSRQDSPIVFASEEFHRTTQYGPEYVLGRNCRFLQGPKTNPFSVQRLREKLAEGKEHYETFLNYRRDGLPFMNLLMCTPLLDSLGRVRYFLGAQIDVSGLVKDCSGLESLRKLVDQDDEERLHGLHSADSSATVSRRDSGADLTEQPTVAALGKATSTSFAKDPTRAPEKQTEFRLLAEMLHRPELETVRRFGGRMHRSQQEQGQPLEASGAWHKPRVVLNDQYETGSPSPLALEGFEGIQMSDANGNINISKSTSEPRGVGSYHVGGGGLGLGTGQKSPATFENYLVVRPFPSLKILFASPSLRVPGILQSHLLSRIGGSRRIHEGLEHAFAMGQSVTAKVKWIRGGLRNAASAGTIPEPTSVASSAGSTSGSGTVMGSGYGRQQPQPQPQPQPQHDAIGQEGRPRWIHCTPLIGMNGTVGVWVVVIIDEDGDGTDRKRTRRDLPRNMAPPVAPHMGTQHAMETAAGRRVRSPHGGSDDTSLTETTRVLGDEEQQQQQQAKPRGRHRTPAPAETREWEKGWEDMRDDSSWNDILRRPPPPPPPPPPPTTGTTEDHHQPHRSSETMAKEFGGASGGLTNGTAFARPGASHGDGAKARDGERGAAGSPSSFERVMGTISTSRGPLLAPPRSEMAGLFTLH